MIQRRHTPEQIIAQLRDARGQVSVSNHATRNTNARSEPENGRHGLSPAIHNQDDRALQLVVSQSLTRHGAFANDDLARASLISPVQDYDPGCQTHQEAYYQTPSRSRRDVGKKTRVFQRLCARRVCKREGRRRAARELAVEHDLDGFRVAVIEPTRGHDGWGDAAVCRNGHVVHVHVIWRVEGNREAGNACRLFIRQVAGGRIG